MTNVSHLEDAYDPNVRWELPPALCGDPLVAIEVTFAIPVYVTHEQHTQLCAVVDAIVRADCNTPREGVHWVSSSGSRLNFSQSDAQFLGVAASSEAPAAGEPTVDSSVFTLASTARYFVTQRERENSLAARERAKVAAKEREAKKSAEKEALDDLLKAAVAHWVGSRPAEYNLQQCLATPDLNTIGEAHRQFSRAVARVIELGLVEVPNE